MNPQIIITLSLDEWRDVRIALWSLVTVEKKKLKRIHKREAAGKRTRVRVSEQAMYVADLDTLARKVDGRVSEMEQLAAKESTP